MNYDITHHYQIPKQPASSNKLRGQSSEKYTVSLFQHVVEQRSEISRKRNAKCLTHTPLQHGNGGEGKEGRSCPPEEAFRNLPIKNTTSG